MDVCCQPLVAESTEGGSIGFLQPSAWFFSVSSGSLMLYYNGEMVTPTNRGAGTIFFLGGGGKHVDMPSDCQNLGGGHRHIHPLQTKSWGAPPPPPPAPAPLPTKVVQYSPREVQQQIGLGYCEIYCCVGSVTREV